MAFPNPTNKSIEITNAVDDSLEDGITARLVSDKGKVVAESRSTDGQLILDTEGIPNGVYVLRVTNGSQIETRRILVRH